MDVEDSGYQGMKHKITFGISVIASVVIFVTTADAKDVAYRVISETAAGRQRHVIRNDSRQRSDDADPLRWMDFRHDGLLRILEKFSCDTSLPAKLSVPFTDESGNVLPLTVDFRILGKRKIGHTDAVLVSFSGTGGIYTRADARGSSGDIADLTIDGRGEFVCDVRTGIPLVGHAGFQRKTFSQMWLSGNAGDDSDGDMNLAFSVIP